MCQNVQKGETMDIKATKFYTVFSNVSKNVIQINTRFSQGKPLALILLIRERDKHFNTSNLER